MVYPFESYPAYKPSGLKWLGDVPVHWEVCKLRRVLAEATKRNRPDLPLLSLVRERGVILRDVTNKDENHNFIPDDLTNYKVVHKGQFAMNKMKAWQGSYGVSQQEGIVSPAYFVFHINGVTGDYFHVAVRSKAYVPFFTQASDWVRIGQWDLSQARMQEIPFLVPPLPEQTAIVRYLDHIDERIRRYVSGKQKLIRLLEEEKQAVINQAVTGQVDVCTGQPYNAYKPSGVEWLGDVPAHWEVRRLKQVSWIQGGFAFSTDSFGNEGVPVVRMNNIRRGALDLDNVVRISEHKCKDAFALNEGDIIYGLSGSIGATGSLGNYAVVRNGDIPAQLNQRVARFRPMIDRITEEFLVGSLQTSVFYEQVLSNTTGTAQFNVSTNDIGNVALALPSVVEQQRIAYHLSTEAAEIDTAIDRARRQIDLLQEYRTRLVADVVTGRLDVRGAVANLPDEADAPEPLEAVGK